MKSRPITVNIEVVTKQTWLHCGTFNKVDELELFSPMDRKVPRGVKGPPTQEGHTRVTSFKGQEGGGRKQTVPLLAHTGAGEGPMDLGIHSPT